MLPHLECVLSEHVLGAMRMMRMRMIIWRMGMRMRMIIRRRFKVVRP